MTYHRTIRRADILATLPQYSNDEIKYWLELLKSEDNRRKRQRKLNGWHTYTPEEINIIRYMGFLIRKLSFTPSTALKVAIAVVDNGVLKGDKCWVELHGVVIGIPYEDVWAA